jgi:tetratricopeptide (TPR) repeat protein
MNRMAHALIAIAAPFCLVRAQSPTASNARKDGPEFTKQALLIIDFAPGAGADIRLGKRAADAVRSRFSRTINKRELDLVDPGAIERALERAGYDIDSVYAIAGIIPLARKLRADEIVIGRVSVQGGTTRIGGDLILTRDKRLHQLLPDVTAPKLDSAAALFAKAIAAARTQIVPERRCENALHDGNGTRALSAGEEGVAAYARSTITRVCVLWSLTQTKSSAAEVLQVAREVLAVDSNNVHAIEFAAIALDSLRRRDEAAAMWLRFAATDTADMELALRVSYSLIDGGNARRGESFIVGVSDAHPQDLQLLRQKWRAAYENHSWATAIAAGEAMRARDADALTDSTFFLRLATAYRSANLPFKAVEAAAYGASTFPKDARLYSLYTQLVRTEADTAIPRGLALFPNNAELEVMSARDLRAKGKLAESLAATRHAVALDSSMSQGHLMIAQIEVELGRPDSALVALRQAVAAGEDSALVAQFALAKGNALYRAASTTKTSADFELSLRFIAFADSVHTTTQSRFLSGVAALGVAQTALAEGAKLPDKKAGCLLAQHGAELVPVARAGVEAGREAFAEAAAQSLQFIAELEAYVAQSRKSCE